MADKRTPLSTATVEAVATQMRANMMPTAYKVVSGIGSTAATLLLGLFGYIYSDLHTEWKEMKTDVAELRRQVERMPTAEEYQHIDDRLDDLTERIILLESRCCSPSVPYTPPSLRGSRR
jgi:hypothetical protein